MSFLLLRPKTLALTSAAVLGLSLTLHTSTQNRAPLTNLPQSSPYAPVYSSRRPLFHSVLSPKESKDDWLDPESIRQMSLGSILGVLAGVGVSAFSKTLALLFGVGVLGVQYASSKGIDLIPKSRLQRYVSETDFAKVLSTKGPLKITFGITFLLAVGLVGFTDYA